MNLKEKALQQHPFFPLPHYSYTIIFSRGSLLHTFYFLCSLNLWIGNHQRNGVRTYSFTNLLLLLLLLIRLLIASGLLICLTAPTAGEWEKRRKYFKCYKSHRDAEWFIINKTNNYPVITQYTVMMASSTGKENINNNNVHKKEKIKSLISACKIHSPVKWGSKLRAMSEVTGGRRCMQLFNIVYTYVPTAP